MERTDRVTGREESGEEEIESEEESNPAASASSAAVGTEAPGESAFLLEVV